MSCLFQLIVSTIAPAAWPPPGGFSSRKRLNPTAWGWGSAQAQPDPGEQLWEQLWVQGTPVRGGPRRLLLHNLQRWPGPRPPHTPVSVTQPYGHRQAHAHKHHEDADRQTATCRHRCVSNCVSEYIQAPAHAGRCLYLWVCKLYIENSFQGLALWSSG